MSFDPMALAQDCTHPAPALDQATVRPETVVRRGHLASSCEKKTIAADDPLRPLNM